MIEKRSLRQKIIRALKKQGFKINPHVRPAGSSKRTYRRVQRLARLEQLAKHKSFLSRNLNAIKDFCRDGTEITPDKIQLELREVKAGSFEEIMFRWWNFIWWSIPYQRAYGRQIRFLLWDKTHDSPFGLIGLQSPPLKMAVRDKFLGIPNKDLDIWANRAMHAQRLGALPPYNELLGGKMVALSLTCNTIRRAYQNKYKDYISIINERQIDPHLLFITTTSAFGKSSIYNRLKYNGQLVGECLGFTKGTGSFHIPEKLYVEILQFLEAKGIDTTRHYGHGPSRKIKLISQGLRQLVLREYEFHGIKR